MKKIRALLIEDNRLLREGLTAMLKEQPDIRVVASAGNSDAMQKWRNLKPDVVLLDVGLRSQNSLRLVKSVKKSTPEAKVIVMDLAPVQTELMEYVRAGVSGFVLKDATFDDFLKTIRSVANGAKVLPPVLTGSLFSQIVDHATQKGKGNPFKSVKMTRREREVIELISEGLSNKEIAQRLSCAIDTVKTHVHNILEKLALHTRLEIASFAHADDGFEPLSRNQ
ncbi:MAG TPA: response regulator transcription factor [Verrucomicrobiae bacterium]|nr:response regulator transcription factor [Verrucomicrobiae bacterium]